ncbi:TetR/AcrR family transcriptional regulator [Streptomyces sp. NBC_01003]|uniref:TetR/AcrR family transcriptional regulator n=1 Tax=Streptomyces sp. NBC_01003 TaxID=2903714 RepID=UPI003865596D|nr:TetR/AcrR family transcriptional regulator [Streptomyces sp. NBC_01003]
MSVTLQMLAGQGYAKLTIGGVAVSAGVGKATIYRSWANKPALVLEALRERLPEVPTENLGDSRAEMLASVTMLAQLFGSHEVREALPGLIADTSQNPELGSDLRDKLVDERKTFSRQVLHRAIERGDLPTDTDVSMVLDSWAGLMLFRRLFYDQVLDDQDVQRLVDTTLASPHRLPEPPATA